MKITKTEYYPPHTEEVIDKVLCDICKNKCHESSYDDCTSPVSTFKLEAREGRYYRDTGSMKTIEYDLCKSCFYDKLVPFMESLGAKTEPNEVYW